MKIRTTYEGQNILISTAYIDGEYEVAVLFDDGEELEMERIKTHAEAQEIFDKFAEKYSAVKRFEIGKAYYTRSIGDHNCIYWFKIIKRTAKMVTIQAESGETKRCRLSIYDGAETFSPCGSYSFAPVISANNETDRTLGEMQDADREAERVGRREILRKRKVVNLDAYRAS